MRTQYEARDRAGREVHSQSQVTDPLAEHSAPVVALAALTVALHVATNAFSPYGVHRDEFLYLAMGRHLDLFRMDFPPAIAILAKISMALGDSLVALRIFPALIVGLLVILAASIARELGGGRYAQILGALCVIASPLFLRAGNLLQPVVVDQLAWTVGLFALVKLGRTNDEKWWVWYGVATGFGLLTKFSAIFFGGATLLALLASPQRRWILTPWPWIAFVLVIAIGSPSWIGQILRRSHACSAFEVAVVRLGGARRPDQHRAEAVSHGAGSLACARGEELGLDVPGGMGARMISVAATAPPRFI